jgi:hypothetical protein
MWRLIAVVIRVGVGGDLYAFNGGHVEAARTVALHTLMGR